MFLYKIGSGTHSAPLAHNKKIKSTALDIRQPAAVQQSISYLTILALLLVFHQDSFQKSRSGSDPPRYIALSSILQLFREISRKNHNSIYTHFQNQFPNLFLDHFRSYRSCISSFIFNLQEKYKMKIYSMQYIVNNTEQKKTLIRC